MKNANAMTVITAICAAISLSACGGGGGGGGIDLPPAPIQPPSTPRGTSSLPGINQIPLSMIKLNNSQMKDRFVIVEGRDPNGPHALGVRQVACQSYTVKCDHHSYYGKHWDIDNEGNFNGVTTYTGTTSYTMITGWGWHTHNPKIVQELNGMSNLKIYSHQQGVGATIFSYISSPPDFLSIISAGNVGNGNHGPIQNTNDDTVNNVKAALAVNKLLFAAGYRKSGSTYLRASSYCKGTRNGGKSEVSEVSDNCLWAQYSFVPGSGTSYSAPQLASALASVLAVLPDTSPQNLSKFAKACARKTGNGIPALLSTHGGVGVANFTCMGTVTTALASLPVGSRTTLSIGGKTVSLGGRDLTVSFLPLQQLVPSLQKQSGPPEGGTLPVSRPGEFLRKRSLSLHLVPTGERTGMVAGTLTRGDMFASVSAGTNDDFFGFTRGHENGVRESRLSAGHANVFAYLSKTWSDGGSSIRSAYGKGAGLMLRRNFSLNENTQIAVSAQAERFLGGKARLRSEGVLFGDVSLPEGGWNHQLHIGSRTTIDDSKNLDLSATVLKMHERDHQSAVSARFRWVF